MYIIAAGFRAFYIFLFSSAPPQLVIEKKNSKEGLYIRKKKKLDAISIPSGHDQTSSILLLYKKGWEEGIQVKGPFERSEQQQ